jgi:hypothetical protein
MLQQHNQALPGVKALAAERLRMCRSRINQAVRDGCLEQYLEDFSAAVKKAQSTTFLRGEGARGRAGELGCFKKRTQTTSLDVESCRGRRFKAPSLHIAFLSEAEEGGC